MAIEVKQMVVRSNVLQKAGQSDDGGCAAEESKMPEEAKSEILDECKKLVMEMLREFKER